MSASRALHGALNCRVCRFPPRNTFKPPGTYRPLSTLLSRRPRLAWKTQDKIQANTRAARGLGSCRVLRAQQKDDGEDLEVFAEDQPRVEPTFSEDTTPWYLRVQDADVPENTLLERQRLPEIPKDSPTQLNGIIKHLSEGIGLEYLTLLDLRELDPPPALGSNLMMIVGTARSTRHLNVSADRFCRWLRATYKLRPHADGLLGRNELKLKLRRRARRAKILGSKLQPSDGDDGIVTGWICVNVGTLDASDTGDQLVRNQEGSVIGFGQSNHGTTLVVQLLTEDKRETLDIEGLWTKYVDRQRRRLARAEDEVESEDLDVEPGILPEETPQAGSMLTAGTAPSSPPIVHGFSSMHAGQRRGLHTMVQHRVSATTNPPRIAGLELTRQLSSTLDRFIPPADFGVEVGMQKSFRQILTLPSDKALAALGSGWEDRTSTPFLVSFYGEKGPMPSVDYYRAQMTLMRLAIEHKHPGYGVPGLLGTLTEACESLVIVPQDIFETVITSVAKLCLLDGVHGGQDNPATEHISTIMNVLEDMSLRGLYFYNQSLFDNLCRMIVKLQQEDRANAEEYLAPYPLAQMAVLADEHQFILSERDHWATALEELIRSNNWDGVWRVWAWYPMREEQRSAELYAAVFRWMADTKHQSACMEALTKMTPTMELEQPPVQVEGTTAVAMMECLRVADPGVQLRYMQGEMQRRPWVQLFQACVEGLEHSHGGQQEPAM